MKKKKGCSFHLDTEEVEKSHSAHDLDGNGFISKDELLWALKMKKEFFKTMCLTDKMRACFLEDLTLTC